MVNNNEEDDMQQDREETSEDDIQITIMSLITLEASRVANWYLIVSRAGVALTKCLLVPSRWKQPLKSTPSSIGAMASLISTLKDINIILEPVTDLMSLSMTEKSPSLPFLVPYYNELLDMLNHEVQGMS